jgi:hypothetical protein
MEFPQRFVFIVGNRIDGDGSSAQGSAPNWCWEGTLTVLSENTDAKLWETTVVSDRDVALGTLGG